MRRIFTILAVALSTIGCIGFSMGETHLYSSEISLTWKGDTQVEYDPDNFQLGYSSDKNEYRVYDDKLSEWFTVSCSETPTDIGQILSADVTWTGEKSTKVFNGIELTVKKTDDSGLIWLWNTSEKIGIVIKNI